MGGDWISCGVVADVFFTSGAVRIWSTYGLFIITMDRCRVKGMGRCHC